MGDFTKGTVNTITGSSGTGKTVFASQFIYSGTLAGEKGMIITPSESSAVSEERDGLLIRLGFLRPGKEKGLLHIVDVTDPVLRLQKSIDVDPADFLMNFRKLSGEEA